MLKVGVAYLGTSIVSAVLLKVHWKGWSCLPRNVDSVSGVVEGPLEGRVGRVGVHVAGNFGVFVAFHGVDRQLMGLADRGVW